MSTISIPELHIIPMGLRYIERYRECLDEVARERRYLGFVEAPPLPSVRDYVERNLASGSPWVVAETCGSIVGWCNIEVFSLEGFKHRGRLGMGVRKGYRGKGIGTALMKSVLAKAGERGLERVELEVFESNRGAIRLYEKAGFEVEGVKKKGRKIDGTYDDVVEMVLFTLGGSHG